MSEITRILDRSVETPSPLERVGERLPINIISGFLGSGKTTAIIRLLEQKDPEENWAIVVNEFGKISIDGQTLQPKSVSGSVYDIVGGCICCSAKAYLSENLEKIIETAQFDRIIIEPSGLGGIEMVSEIISILPGLQQMPVICMIDITAIENPRLQRNLIYRNQIENADRIVFSKSDLLDDPLERDERIARFNALFPGRNTALGTQDLNSLLLFQGSTETSGRNTRSTGFYPAQQLDDSSYAEQYFSWDAQLIFDPELFQEFTAKNPEIIRLKGHIRTHEGWLLINHSFSGINFSPCPEKQRNELVIIAAKTALKPNGLESMLDSLYFKLKT